MKSPKIKSQSKAFLEDDDGLNAVLCEFDAVIEDFTSPVEKRHFRYDEHLKTMKRRSSASVSDSGISDSESAESLNRNSFSFSDEKLNSPSVFSPSSISPLVTSPKPKLGDTKELEDFIADLDRTLANKNIYVDSFKLSPMVSVRGGFGGSWIWVDWEKRRSVVFHQRGDNSLSSACQRRDSRADALCHRKGPEHGFCVQRILFFTEQMIDLIVSMTNLHGRRTMRKWTPQISVPTWGIPILAGVYRSRGESTRCLWDHRLPLLFLLRKKQIEHRIDVLDPCDGIARPPWSHASGRLKKGSCLRVGGKPHFAVSPNSPRSRILRIFLAFSGS
ncbi:unnamed protein product [Leuciscus chuanchicus]